MNGAYWFNHKEPTWHDETELYEDKTEKERVRPARRRMKGPAYSREANSK